METKYVETNDDIPVTEHGVEFHHSAVSRDSGLFLEGRAIAFIPGHDWVEGRPASVEVIIRPASSPLLADREREPEKIIADVKGAVELFLENVSRRGQGQITRSVRTWYR
ncbi:MAG TPA: hypothetical protein VI078_01370 [bacterium]